MSFEQLLTLVFGMPGLLVFLPLIGAVGLSMVPRNKSLLWTCLVMLAVFGLSIPMWFNYGPGSEGVAYEVDIPWFGPLLGAMIRFHLGIDGISLLLVLLTTFITPIVVISAYGHIHERRKEFCFWMLVMETGMLGTFMALDLFVFYVFWEVMLVPLYFIIGIWGGPRKIYAAIKFFLYTLAGSLLMLAAIIYLILQSPKLGTAGPGQAVRATTQILELAERNPLAWTPQVLCFLAFWTSFAIKVPLFPFHTWLPDAHVEAPTSGSVILAGVLLKMGTYGFLRFCLPLFPNATVFFTPYILVLALIGIVYGALLAWAQGDMKKLVAYSSISHLGFVVLGTYALDMVSMEGSLLQMVNHGLSTGALFLLVGMVYERRHTRIIDEFGGIAKVMPVYAFFLMIATLASIGLPGTNGFIGEFMILLGTFNKYPVFAAIAATGVILGAIYMLSMVRRVLFGPLTRRENKELKDIGAREIGILIPIAVLIFWIGIYPSPFLKRTEKTLKKIEQRVVKVVSEVK